MEHNDNYTKILSLALEIEGLAVLMQRRGELINPDIKNILRDKVKQLSAIVNDNNGQSSPSLTMSATPAEIAVKDNSITWEGELLDVESPVDDTCHPDVVTLEVEPGDLSPTEEVLEKEVESRIETRLESERQEEEQNIAEAVELEQSEDSIVLPEEVAPETPRRQQPAKDINAILKIFTLNDRFRFTRELFDNKDENFKEALQQLADMNSPEDVRDYIENDLCLDIENPDVLDFYAVIVTKLLA